MCMQTACILSTVGSLHEFAYSSVLQTFSLMFFNTILLILTTEFLAPLNVVPEMLWDELYPHLHFYVTFYGHRVTADVIS